MAWRRAINAQGYDMTLLKWLIAVAAVFGGFVALMYVAQRALMYHPEVLRTPPATAGLVDLQELVLDAADGEKVIVWYTPPKRDLPLVLYFHGNAGALRHRANRFRALTDDGYGLVALSYRGYGGSTGSPSEAGMIADAQAAYAFAAARAPAERIVVFGESLGTGVAVALAATERIGRLVLEAPFASAADIGAGLLVSAGAALDERPVPLGSADRQGDGAASGAAWRTRPGGPN